MLVIFLEGCQHAVPALGARSTVMAAQNTRPGRSSIFAQLWFQVLVGTLLGIAVGWLAPGTGSAMKPLGDAFIKLIRMMIGPVIFVTVVHGIARVSDMRSV